MLIEKPPPLRCLFSSFSSYSYPNSCSCLPPPPSTSQSNSVPHQGPLPVSQEEDFQPVGNSAKLTRLMRRMETLATFNRFQVPGKNGGQF